MEPTSAPRATRLPCRVLMPELMLESDDSIALKLPAM
jgi:hypothetical protein